MNTNAQLRSAPVHPQRRRPRAGIALILVLTVVAMATIVAMALLSTSALQSQVSGGSGAVTEADSLAESGIDIAEFYLMHPERASTLTSDGYWPGQSSATSLGISGGTISQITVALNSQPATNVRRFDVTATGTAVIPNSGNRTVARTAKATIDVTGKYVVPYALAANGNVTVPALWTMHVKGDARVDGTYTSFSVLDLLGSLLSRDSGNTNAPPNYPTKAVPTISQLRLVQSLPNYTYNGQVYQAEQLTATSYSGTLQTTNLSRNPANVWYATATRSFTGTVPGTLIIVGSASNLKVTGGLRITPKSGMPGLIVQNDVQFAGLLGSSLRVDGLMWVGNNITTGGLSVTATLEVYGSLMLAGASPTIGSLLTGSATVQFNSTNVNNLPADFSLVNQTPQTLKLQTWSQ